MWFSRLERIARGLVLLCALILSPLSEVVLAQTPSNGVLDSFKLLLRDEEKEESPFNVVFRASLGKQQVGPEIEYSPEMFQLKREAKLVCSLGCLYDINDEEPLLTCGVETRIRLGEDGDYGTLGFGCFGRCEVEDFGRGFDAYAQVRYGITLEEIGYKPETLLEKFIGSIGIEGSFACDPAGEFDVGVRFTLGTIF